MKMGSCGLLEMTEKEFDWMSVSGCLSVVVGTANSSASLDVSGHENSPVPKKEAVTELMTASLRMHTSKLVGSLWRRC